MFTHPTHLVCLRHCIRKRGLCRHVVSVCPSVTFVYSVKMSYRIFKLFFQNWIAKPF